MTETSETSETAETKRPKQAKINEKLKLENTTFILHQLYPRVWHRDITNSRRACKDDWAKHDEHENIEKKVVLFSKKEKQAI